MWTNKTSGFETTQTDDMKMQMLQIKAANEKYKIQIYWPKHSLFSVLNTKNEVYLLQVLKDSLGSEAADSYRQLNIKP